MYAHTEAEWRIACVLRALGPDFVPRELRWQVSPGRETHDPCFAHALQAWRLACETRGSCFGETQGVAFWRDT